MDKQKQIEEMAKKSGGCLYPNNHCGVNGKSYCWCDARRLCENLAEHYEPKIPENAVVLTEEEYKKLKHGSGTLEHLYKQYPYRVLVGFNSMVFSQDRESYEKLYDEIEEKASKATAEKFAEMAKAVAYYTVCDTRCVSVSRIDEICKELTEGKV